MNLPKGYATWSSERKRLHHATQGLPPMVRAALRQRHAQRAGRRASRASFPRVSRQPPGRD